MSLTCTVLLENYHLFTKIGLSDSWWPLEVLLVEYDSRINISRITFHACILLPSYVTHTVFFEMLALRYFSKWNYLQGRSRSSTTSPLDIPHVAITVPYMFVSCIVSKVLWYICRKFNIFPTPRVLAVPFIIQRWWLGIGFSRFDTIFAHLHVHCMCIEQ